MSQTGWSGDTRATWLDLAGWQGDNIMVRGAAGASCTRRRAGASALVVAVLLLSYPVMVIERWPRPHSAAHLATGFTTDPNKLSSPLLPHIKVLETVAARYSPGDTTRKQAARNGVQAAGSVVQESTSGQAVDEQQEHPKQQQQLPRPSEASAKPAGRYIGARIWPCGVPNPAGSWSPAPPPMTYAEAVQGTSLVEAMHRTEFIWSDHFLLALPTPLFRLNGNRRSACI